MSKLFEHLQAYQTRERTHRPLLEADLAVAQGDVDKASALIRAVLNSMFEV